MRSTPAEDFHLRTKEKGILDSVQLFENTSSFTNCAAATFQKFVSNTKMVYIFVVQNHTEDSEKSFQKTQYLKPIKYRCMYPILDSDIQSDGAVESSRRNMACNKISIQEIGKQSGASGIPESRTIVGKTHMNLDGCTNRRSYSISL